MVHTIAIIGAGFAGLSTAKVMSEFGYDVTVYEAESEVGGVWASSRRYPGLTTQNVASTYCLSDAPYPRDYPEWPTGEQVQQYLETYVDRHNLRERIRLNTRVTAAVQDSDASWTMTTESGDTSHYDLLIVCNGVYSEVAIPDFVGAADFTASGGRICHTTEFHDPAEAQGRRVLVVGYGKSSCDVAFSCVGVAESVSIVARRLLWKIPRKLKNVVNFKMLFLTRMGEGLFPYRETHGFESFLHGPGRGVRNGMVGSVQSVIAGQQHLDDLGLRPDKPLETIFQGSVGLETPGFFDAIASGNINVYKDTGIARLEPHRAILEDGTEVECDIIICGTGFHQRVPFLDEQMQGKIRDEEGTFRLYRHMIPVGTTNLAFNGYNSSFFSQLNAEIGALWLVNYLKGGFTLPSEAEQNAELDAYLAWQAERTDGHTSSGTNLVPFSIHNVDELLTDMGMKVGALQRQKEWLLPVSPLDYQKFTQKLKKRYSTEAS